MLLSHFVMFTIIYVVRFGFIYFSCLSASADRTIEHMIHTDGHELIAMSMTYARHIQTNTCLGHRV